MPSRKRLGRDPDCEAAPLLQCPVVLWPVADLVARPRDLVAARFIGLVGHRASGKRGSGPIRSPLAQPKPKARNFAPTPVRLGLAAALGAVPGRALARGLRLCGLAPALFSLCSFQVIPVLLRALFVRGAGLVQCDSNGLLGVLHLGAGTSDAQ